MSKNINTFQHIICLTYMLLSVMYIITEFRLKLKLKYTDNNETHIPIDEIIAHFGKYMYNTL